MRKNNYFYIRMKKSHIYLIGVLLIFSCAGRDKKEADNKSALPDDNRLEGKNYGITNLSVSNMRRINDFDSEMISQGLLGMPVRVLRRDNWFHIQTPDDYRGWVNSSAIVQMTKEEYHAWNAAEKVVVTSHYGFTYEMPDVASQPVSDVVAGNRLKLEGKEGDFYQVSYPDGRNAWISQSISMAEKEWRTSLKQDAESIIRTARSLIGVPYLWGGTSSKGMDCSGYVRTVLFMHDIIIPRDAYQQAGVGQRIDIAADFNNLQLGDLIFFGQKATTESKERVIHVGIYIGEKKFIHSQGYVYISSFDRDDSAYDKYNLNRLLYATRILDATGKHPQINTTLTNPYYLQQ